MERLMKLSEFYNEVARKVDTSKTKINAAEARRVVSQAFKVLAGLDNPTMLNLIAKGVTYAVKKK
jgi:hypothetical protein